MYYLFGVLDSSKLERLIKKYIKEYYSPVRYSFRDLKQRNKFKTLQ